jgi:ketosteroid isomerase-like protein
MPHAYQKEEETMSEVDDFLDAMLPRQMVAEKALHQGDSAPRSLTWSPNDPVTLFGAWGPCNTGWDEVSRTFGWVASRFSAGAEYSFDLLAAGASGDLAYTVGFENVSVSTDGGPVERIRLRVTHVYRRENGEWRIVHRHGDFPPVDESAAHTA